MKRFDPKLPNIEIIKLVSLGADPCAHYLCNIWARRLAKGLKWLKHIRGLALLGVDTPTNTNT